MDSPRPSPKSKSRVRLQKYLAQCGVGSRRRCEDLIAAGVVRVNGEVVSTPGTSVAPGDDVRVHGRAVQPERTVYRVLNKPRDVLCTRSDPQGRRTVFDLIGAQDARLFHVGRLDRDSEGLLLLTNDGELGARLTHARHGVRKVYRVSLSRALTTPERDRLVRGVQDAGETLRAEAVTAVESSARGPEVEIVLHEGRNRQIRRMMAALGVEIVRLRRVALGPLRLGALRRGQCRDLTAEEIRGLRGAAGLPVDGPGVIC